MTMGTPQDGVSQRVGAPSKPIEANPRHLIYVVDDEITVGEVISMHLQRHGYRTQVFRSPVIAFATFALVPVRPSVLITDYAMEEMNGLELMRKCKQLCPRLKVISMSASADLELLQKAEDKPDVVLGKPFASERLVVEVENLLGDREVP